MSDDNEKFSVESFLKKVQEGDKTLLIIGAIVMLVPMIALFFLAGGKTDKKLTQQKLKTMVQRKNVFNFGKKNENDTKSAPKSKNSWFGGSRTVEQQVSDELRDAMRVIEQEMKKVRVPSNLTGDAKLMYEAEHDYNLCMGNGALEARNYKEAEKYFQEAIDNARGNPFLLAYTYGSLCALYETTGDMKKLEAAYKKYFEAVGKLPEEYGGGDLNSIARNAYMSLKYLSDSDPSKLSEEIANNPMVQRGTVSSNIDIKNVFKSFPVKYDE